MEIGAIVFWLLATVVAVALLVWWWLGVHRKTRQEQAAKLAAQGAARRERGHRPTDTNFDPVPPPGGHDPTA